MGDLFGTDGVRGLANREPLTPPTLVVLGRAIGETMRARRLPLRAIMGRDPRRSGGMVGGAVMSGLCSAGVGVTVCGVLPTPAVARLARAGRFGLGLVISASHNAAADNGVKLFYGNGRKAEPDFEAAVETRMSDATGDGSEVEPGEFVPRTDAPEEYVTSIVREFGGLSLSGMKVAVDCANGAMSGPAPAALARLGAEVTAIHERPSGKNINRRCGALHPQASVRAVGKHGADVGISFDGDGDRAVFVTETGRVLDGDAVMAILARDLLDRRQLRKRTVVATVMSNLGLVLSLREAGCRVVRTPVGDRNVVAEMDCGGYSLGGEQSGHIVVRRASRLIGDGLETALHVLAAMKKNGSRLSALGACFNRLPQRLVNVRVSERKPLEELPSVQAAIRRVEQELEDAGRVLVRYSGTEPLARVMVEGPGTGFVKKAAGTIAHAIRMEIGSDS